MKTLGWFGCGMLFVALLTVPGIDASDAEDGERVSVAAHGISYVEPNGAGWVRKYSTETDGTYLRVYVNRILPKRELMIFLERTTAFDVSDPALQDHYIAMMPGAVVLRRQVGNELGPATLALEFETAWQDQVMKGRMLICFQNGFAFRCMVGTYGPSLADDAELVGLLQAIKVKTVAEGAD